MIDQDSVERYLETLRRIPADIRQSMATRTFDMDNRAACVCGWAIREELAAAGSALLDDEPYVAESQSFRQWPGGTPETCSEMFGGEAVEWSDIFTGVQDRRELPAIEEAFAIAVSETVRVPRKRVAPLRRQGSKGGTR